MIANFRWLPIGRTDEQPAPKSHAPVSLEDIHRVTNAVYDLLADEGKWAADAIVEWIERQRNR